MAVVRHFGKPSLFITMTCNPKWKEIMQELKPHQQPTERPDLVARVFRIKLEALLDDLKRGLFGKVCALLHVVEFQKRGLPHAHNLVILAPEDRILTSERVDDIVCAEIPDNEREPELYELVATHMMHGPCGPVNPKQVCMEKDEKTNTPRCSKQFPKPYQEVTDISGNGYPKYRRRNDGRICTK